MAEIFYFSKFKFVRMKETTTTKTSIKEWAESDRPREKMMLNGKESLSDAELIAILISSGNSNESAVDLSKRILNDRNNNLRELVKLNIAELMRYRGIGEAKAIAILAALELGKRFESTIPVKKEIITSSKDIHRLIYPSLSDKDYEEFWVVLLNQANKVIFKTAISEGGQTSTVVDPRKVFKLAIDHKACSMILCHNHPSGNVKPSEQDIKLTKQIKEGGHFLDIQILDHIILGESDAYFSFADHGIL